jgi:hypothetical protein
MFSSLKNFAAVRLCYYFSVKNATLKGQAHEKIGKLRVWGIRLRP